MNDFNSQFNMTPSEKARMRDSVRTYMTMKPLGQKPVSVRTAYAWMFSMRPVAALLVLVLFFGSGGISYAAENALPGDALYTIKTKVNEPIKGALAVSASAKARWAAEVAQTRVQEAATLAAEGKLNDEVQQLLAQSFDEHAQLATNLIEDTASTSPDTSAASAVALEASLSESGRVLAQVGDAKGISTKKLANVVDEAKVRAGAVRQAVEERLAIAATKTPGISAAASIRTSAEATLADSQQLASDASGALDTDSAAQVAAQITGAQETFAQGDKQLSENDNAQAQASFTQALAATQKLGVFLKTTAAIHDRTGLTIADASKQKHDNAAQQSTRPKAFAAPHPTETIAPAAQVQTTSSSASSPSGESTTTEASTTEPTHEDMTPRHQNDSSKDEGDNHSDDNDSHTIRLSVPTTSLH